MSGSCSSASGDKLECPGPAPCTPVASSWTLQLQPRLQPSLLLHPALGPEVALVPVGHKRLRLKWIKLNVWCAASQLASVVGRERCMSGGSLLYLVISLSQPCSFSIASSSLSLPSILPIINLSSVELRYRLAKWKIRVLMIELGDGGLGGCGSDSGTKPSPAGESSHLGGELEVEL